MEDLRYGLQMLGFMLGMLLLFVVALLSWAAGGPVQLVEGVMGWERPGPDFTSGMPSRGEFGVWVGTRPSGTELRLHLTPWGPISGDHGCRLDVRQAATETTRTLRGFWGSSDNDLYFLGPARVAVIHVDGDALMFRWKDAIPAPVRLARVR